MEFVVLCLPFAWPAATGPCLCHAVGKQTVLKYTRRACTLSFRSFQVYLGIFHRRHAAFATSKWRRKSFNRNDLVIILPS